MKTANLMSVVSGAFGSAGADDAHVLVPDPVRVHGNVEVIGPRENIETVRVGGPAVTVLRGELLIVEPVGQFQHRRIGEERGLDLRGYKPGTLGRRLRKRLAEVNAHNYREYLDFVQREPGEINQLLNTLLICGLAVIGQALTSGSCSGSATCRPTRRSGV